jgi:Carboxypeptidase regulatory-like domain/TonB-dependent Receptor Plug Domain/TonB dependent receptor
MSPLRLQSRASDPGSDRKPNSNWSNAARLTFLACAITTICHAQSASTGAIAGTVTDPSGAVVSGAEITVRNPSTGASFTALTSPSGTYLAPLLPPGSYEVQAVKQGFRASKYPNITVNVTETAPLNIRLQVGARTETVEVHTAAEQIQTESSALGHVVDGNDIRSLPLVTRNYTQILGLSPGVSTEVFNAGEIGRGGIDDNVVVSGGHASDNNFQMNGVEINDLQGSGHFSGGVAIPNPDTLQEFKVQTSQFDASYGRDAGGNVDVVTKSGTNNYHGSLWEYFRNEDLNANDYFRNQTAQPRPVLKQNQFGFTLGGPVKKDKLLFFLSYQGTRQRNGVDSDCSSSVILPLLTSDRSPAGLAAAVGPNTDFGGTDPAGRSVLPDGSNISPQTVALFNFKGPDGHFLIPDPQVVRTNPSTGLLQGFSTFSDACKFNEDQFMTNFDWLQTSRSTLQARFFFANSQQTTTLPAAHVLGAASIPGFPSDNPQGFRNFSLSHTYVFNPHLINQAEFGFHRTQTRVVQSQPFSYSDIGVTAPSFDNETPVIAIGGGLNLGGNGQTVHLAQNTFVGQDTLFWTRGRHSFRFGGSVSRTQDNFTHFTLGGILVFLDYPSLFIGQAPLDPFLVEDLAGLPERSWRILDASGFVQDDYKVTSRLTLNLGFRYERLGDFGDALGRNSSVDLSLLDPNPPVTGSLAGIVVSSNFPGTLPPGVVSSGNTFGIKGTGQNTWNPRIGFAWRLPRTERLVLRGGYGIYRQRASGQPYLQQVTNQPFGQLRAILPNLTTGFDNPFPPDPGAFPQFTPYGPDPDPTKQLSVLTLDPNVRPPMLQRYSLNLQSQLTRDMALEVGYAGMRATHMLIIRTPNQAPLASVSDPIRGETTNTVANLPFRVPFQGWSINQMNFIQSTGFAWYNGLEASLRKRFSHGLQFLASYTFARDLGNSSENTTGVNGGSIFGNQNDPHRNYGPDDFVREHRFVFSGEYELPLLSGRSALMRQLLGGWKIAGVTTIQSGQRLTVSDQNINNVFGVISDFAEIVPGCHVNTGGSTTGKLNQFFNTGCFTNASYPVVGDPEFDPATGTVHPIATAFGNSSVGIVHGPSQVNTDLSIIKMFALPWRPESSNLEFRAEFFNAFNHPIFANPDVVVADGPQFGQVTTTASNPRLLQFALKLNF